MQAEKENLTLRAMAEAYLELDEKHYSDALRIIHMARSPNNWPRFLSVLRGKVIEKMDLERQ